MSHFRVGPSSVIVRLAAILFAVSLSAQAALPGGTIWVCRYTGQRLAPCACPAPPPPQNPHLLPQGCCELRQSPHADVQGVVPLLDSRLPLLALEGSVPSLVPPPGPTEAPGARVRAGHDPPPRERRFLTLRQLLI